MSSNVPANLPADALPRWRAAVRHALLATVRPESQLIANLQNKIRTPWLDAYFVYTSSLGTHTFFMTFLPIFYFFGYEELGRGLLFQLAAGVYCSSVIKDLFCSPRPFSPPVTRLTIGSHHLEYGFPSTHSTNSVSIGLFFFAHIYDLTYPPSSTTTPSISPISFTILTIFLLFYTFSIVFGRIYTAMHSFTDCLTGTILGSLIWWCSTSFRGIPISISNLNFTLGKGLSLENTLWNWLIETSNNTKSSYIVPIILISLIFILVNQHPQPVDDCPCFEDAIAFASVVFGFSLGRWIILQFKLPLVELGGGGKGLVMPGSGWIFEQTIGGGEWIQIDRTWMDIGIWWSCALLKMLFGILTIFTWRLLTKSLLHLILPPLFRFLSTLIQLPNRRFYTPATEYKNVPSEISLDVGPEGDFNGVTVLHPIPSLIDLSVLSGDNDEDGYGDEGYGYGKDEKYGRGGYAKGSAVEVKGRTSRKSGLRNVVIGRNGNMNANGEEKGTRVKKTVKIDEGEDDDDDDDGDEYDPKARDKDGELVKHYDADVLTKVIVYTGIAILAIEILPITFQILGLGLRSSPF